MTEFLAGQFELVAVKQIIGTDKKTKMAPKLGTGAPSTWKENLVTRLSSLPFDLDENARWQG